MNNIDEWYNIEVDPNDKDIAVDKREFVDNNGVDIYSKKSGEKTVEERIKTSRTLKIKNNKWNQVDFAEDFSNDKITINPQCYQYASSFDDVEFEKKYQDIIENSKYKGILLGNEKVTVNYQIINDIIRMCYTKLKQDYTLVWVVVMTCEYCGIGLTTMWKKLNAEFQLQVMEDLKEVSKLPNEFIKNDMKLF